MKRGKPPDEQCSKDCRSQETRMPKGLEAWNVMKSLTNFELYKIAGAFGARLQG